MENFILLVDSHHGIYMAQSAIEQLLKMENVELNLIQSDIDILLKGPDHEEYIELCNDAFDETEVYIDGVKYGVCWNEDLWLVRDNLSDKEWEDFLI